MADFLLLLLKMCLYELMFEIIHLAIEIFNYLISFFELIIQGN